MPNERDDMLFDVNQEVRVLGTANKIGIIRDTRRRPNGGVDCLVWFGGGDEDWYSSASLVLNGTEHESYTTVELQTFLKDLAIIKLENNLSDTLYSYLGTRTHKEPYQFKPALKFLESPNQRILIADEVGLGKTIEAGIIYLELKARLDLQRTVIVCPSGLRYKWQDEMYNRFDEEFTVMDSSNFAVFLDRFEQSGRTYPIKAIISLETMRRREIQDRLNEINLPLDLTIVDEAHHMRNPSTLGHELGLTLSSNSDAMVILTATPVQLRSADLFYLLHMLDEGEFEDLDTFEQLLAPNIHINRASQVLSANPKDLGVVVNELRKVESTVQRNRFLANPYYDYLVHQLEDSSVLGKQKLIELQRGLQQLNTMAHMFNRTTKKDVAPGARRSATVVGVDLSIEEWEFYEAVLEHTRARYRNENNTLRNPPPFAIVQRERQAASCIAAAKEYILDYMNDNKSDIGVESNSPEDVETLDSYPNDGVSHLVSICRSLGTKDTKLSMFNETINGIYSETPNSKVLVFSFFKRTLNYLYDQLTSSDSPFKESVWKIHGDVPQNLRRRIIEEFKNKAGFGILLLSEIGAEGLDFQFCDVLINYDLPWNPMRVEQRIGRLDRYGQTHERIRIFSFVINDTIEERILQRLYQRIRVFEESIGELEPILGNEISLLEQELFRSALSKDQEEEKLELMLRSIEFRQQELEEFTEQQHSLMGQDIIFDQESDDIQASGRFISANEIASVFTSFISERPGNNKMEVNDRQNGIYTVKTNAPTQNYINRHASQNNYSLQLKSTLRDKLDNRLGFPVTFDSELAQQRPLLEFLHLRHPLIGCALEHFSEKPRIPAMSRLGNVVAKLNNVNTGDYAFFIYLLNGSGIERLNKLVVVVLDPHTLERYDLIESHILAALQTAQPLSIISHDWDWGALFDTAQDQFADMRDQQESESSDRNNALVETRIAGVRQTFGFKIDRALALGNSATNSNIQRMRFGQARNLGEKMETKIDELEKSRNVSVGGNLVSAGAIRILNKVHPED